MFSLRIATFLALMSAAAAAGERPMPPGPLSIGPMTATELGRHLFESPALSSNGEVSCATCHDPERSFTDGLAQSKGVLDIEVGRNASTLFGVGELVAFPGAKIEGLKVREAVLSLEERCMAPIENPLEMGEEIDGVVASLHADDRWRTRFDEAFAPPYEGVTRERLGKALAKHVRSLELPETPYRSYLEGDPMALTLVQREGLGVFEGSGRCDECHQGPALSDGLVHVAREAKNARAPQTEEQRERKQKLETLLFRRIREIQKEAGPAGPASPRVLRLGEAAGLGGYGGPTDRGHRQTLTLWDVSRTGPYFRLGDVDELEPAVRQHIAELRLVSKRSRRQLRRAVSQIPDSLQPRWLEAESKPPFPAELSDDEIAHLMEFLSSLSPAG